MRGCPLIEWVLFSAVWAMLLIPLWKVTGGHLPTLQRESRSGTAEGAEQKGCTPVWFRLLFSEAPLGFKIYAGDAIVWSETDPDNSIEQLLELQSSSPDLKLEAEWPNAGRRAVELRVEPVEGKPWGQVLWTDERMLHERLLPK